MKKLYIHIGLPKTATSSIQSFLFKNSHLLSKHGYHYVSTGLNNELQCHHDLIWKTGLHCGPDYVQKDIQKYRNTTFQELTAEHQQCSDKHLIISSELLTFLDEFNKLTPILSIFKKRDIKFIVNLRRQDTFLESLYQQVVKDGVGDTFQKWYPKARKIADYNHLIKNLLQITEKENITIGIFDSSKKDFNPIKDFLSSIGLHNTTIPIENCYSNKSMPSSCIKIIRLSNYLNLKINYQLVNFFSKHINKLRFLDSRKGYLNDKQRKIIMREYSTSNKALTELIELPHTVKQNILSW